MIDPLSQHARLLHLLRIGRPHRHSLTLSFSGGHIHRGLCCKRRPLTHYSAVPLHFIPHQRLLGSSLPVPRLWHACKGRQLAGRGCSESGLSQGKPSSPRARTGRGFALASRSRNEETSLQRRFSVICTVACDSIGCSAGSHIWRAYDEYHSTSALNRGTSVRHPAVLSEIRASGSAVGDCEAFRAGLVAAALRL